MLPARQGSRLGGLRELVDRLLASALQNAARTWQGRGEMKKERYGCINPDIFEYIKLQKIMDKAILKALKKGWGKKKQEVK